MLTHRSRSVRSPSFRTWYTLVSYDLVCICETWLNDTVLSTELIQGYSIFRRDRACKTGGGVLIAVKSDLQAIRCDDLSLRSKRFPLVSEQKRSWKETFGFDRARNETRTKKWKSGEGERKEGKVSFLSSPPPPRSFTWAILRAVFDSCSSFFAPKPHKNACYAGYDDLERDNTEMVAVEIFTSSKPLILFTFYRPPDSNNVDLLRPIKFIFEGQHWI